MYLDEIEKVLMHETELMPLVVASVANELVIVFAPVLELGPMLELELGPVFVLG